MSGQCCVNIGSMTEKWLVQCRHPNSTFDSDILLSFSTLDDNTECQAVYRNHQLQYIKSMRRRDTLPITSYWHRVTSQHSSTSLALLKQSFYCLFSIHSSHHSGFYITSDKRTTRTLLDLDQFDCPWEPQLELHGTNSDEWKLLFGSFMYETHAYLF